MAGDYLAYQKANARVSFDRQILATDDTTALNNLIAPKSSSHAIYVQKITFKETTESNGKSLTFQDDSSTPIVLGKYSSVTAAAGILKSFEADFGPAGYALGTGKNFDIVVSAAGIAGAFHLEGYQKLIGPVALDQGSQGIPPRNVQG